MSANSIEIQDINTIRRDINEKIICQTNKLYIKKHFLPKSEINYAELMYLNIVKDILCNANCQITELVHKKLNSKLDKECHKKPLHKKIQEYKKCYEKEHCSDSDIFNECCSPSLGITEF